MHSIMLRRFGDGNADGLLPESWDISCGHTLLRKVRKVFKCSAAKMETVNG